MNWAGVGWVKRSAPIRKMENGNDARIVRRQTYNETGFVETNLMGLLCVTHPTWNVMRFVLPACWGLLIDGFASRPSQKLRTGLTHVYRRFIKRRCKLINFGCKQVEFNRFVY